MYRYSILYLTFSARSSLAEHKSHLSANSSFFAVVSSYFAFKACNPSSTSRSLVLASFNTRSVSSSDPLASASLAYTFNHMIDSNVHVHVHVINVIIIIGLTLLGATLLATI